MNAGAQGHEDFSSGPAQGSSVALADALETLREALSALRLPLATPGVEQDRRSRAVALAQLDDYLLPRLRDHAAPLLVVVGGSTGAGKSTLVNSLLGEQVSSPGVLRPTTRAPVLVHHPGDARWFDSSRVLGGLARVHAPDAASGAVDAAVTAPTQVLRLAASARLPIGLALLDAPDIDSVETANRDLAAQLLGAADLWLFVTTAARYADAVPWDLLLAAVERQAQVALVIDRVDPGAERVAEDLRRMMDGQGLADAPLFVIAEATLESGLLPEAVVAELAAWLMELAADPSSRDAMVAATRDGVVEDMLRRAHRLSVAGREQAGADARLRVLVARSHRSAAERVRQATSDGAMLRGEVLARWQDFVGTSEFFRGVERGVGRVRDRVVGFFRGSAAQPVAVQEAIAHGLEAVILDAVEQAAEESYAAWRGDQAGAVLLADLELSRGSADLRAQITAEIRAWQSDVLALVREQGEGKRGLARALSFGVNGLGVALMVVVFASTGGLTGAEIGIAGGTAVVAQKLLEAVFGDDAVRRLTTSAHESLLSRVDGILDAQQSRYTRRLDAEGAAAPGAEELAVAATLVDAAAQAELADRRDAMARPGEPTVDASAAPGPGLRGAELWPQVRAARENPEPESSVPDDAAVQEGPVEQPRAGWWRRWLGRGDGGQD